MALNKKHGFPNSYVKGNSPSDKEKLYLHVHDELRKIEASIRRLNTLTPQAADSEPSDKLISMQRFAVAPWDPLGTGSNVWVYWDGTNWAAL